jgi:hypothetical protein
VIAQDAEGEEGDAHAVSIIGDGHRLDGNSGQRIADSV